MKTIELTPPRGLNRVKLGNKFLIMGIIFLTCENFLIFATGTGALLCWLGACLEIHRMAAIGGVAFILGLAPRAFREAARDFRRIQKHG